MKKINPVDRRANPGTETHSPWFCANCQSRLGEGMHCPKGCYATGLKTKELDQHAPGAKLDQGKIQAGILLQFGRALEAVAEVCTYGAGKYSRGGWQHVENGTERYTDAMMRHLLAEGRSAEDEESGLAHAAHAAWNALARLEFMLKEDDNGQE